MKSIENTFQKLSQIEHVLKRPDTYIGSVTKTNNELLVFSDEKIIKKYTYYTPGFLKIFDEILTNATDHSFRDSSLSKIKVNIDETTGEISIYNNGDGIPVVIHKDHGIYVPELIFGHLLSGSNYNDDEQRKGAGRNGLGATLCIIFSKKFTVETVDSINKKKFTQTYEENMSIVKKAKVIDSLAKSYTLIKFLPDYEKLDMSGLDSETKSLLYKRVYDCIAYTSKTVSIFLNDKKLVGKGIQDYCKYITSETPIAYENISGWEYLVFLNDGYQQVSFVNGNNTVSGGKHVDYILNQITSSLKEKIEKSKKILNIKPSIIKDNIFIVLSCSINNPTFTSQTKEILSSLPKDLNIKISDTFIKKLYSSNITEKVIEITSFKEKKLLDKGVSSFKKSKMIVKNLEDATNAGTSKSQLCSLILTEGISASSFAVSGLSIVGRANWGIFPLRGKVLNIREATQSQLLKNEEILNIKKIMGLQHSKKYITYEEISTLRYGSITILADSDHDGNHIAGLIMNVFHYWWPELMKKEGFIKTIRTPIVKVTKGNKSINFYDEKGYLEFKETGWKAKYYKGLGTSTSSEAKETFKDIKTNMGIYVDDPEVDKSFELAFDKKKADDRKVWLKNVPDENAKRDDKNQIKYSDFINKELIHFSNYDNIRSIPHLMDGLKPSQRKVLFTAFKRNLTTEIKVAQFGASVAELTSYHHGEVSLSSTIIGMAQNYPGSNNINLLEPCGNFGFRNHNGKDAASPRYIFTHITKISRKLFVKEDDDILLYNNDNGSPIEPKFYTPNLPMILVNGSVGIGTGYSTNIPSYNPKDIINNIKLILSGKQAIDLVPWYSGFCGTIHKEDSGFTLRGLMQINGNNIHITEIPLNISISDYKEFLETFEDFSVLNNSTENKPDFLLKFKTKETLLKYDYKKLKLEQKINTSNMHLFDENNTIKKYNDPNDIISDFLKVKLIYINKRKEYLLNKYNADIYTLQFKRKFLEDIITNKIDIYRKSKKDIENILVKNKYPKIKDSYGYLINLPISSFTFENLTELDKLILEFVKTKDDLQSKTIKEMLLIDIKNILT